MSRKHAPEAEAINYPYGAVMIVGPHPQLYIRVAKKGNSIKSNWLPVTHITSEKLEPKNRFSPYLRKAVTKNKDVYEFREDSGMWEVLAVAVTAVTRPKVTENIRQILVSTTEVETETREEAAV